MRPPARSSFNTNASGSRNTSAFDGVVVRTRGGNGGCRVHAGRAVQGEGCAGAKIAGKEGCRGLMALPARTKSQASRESGRYTKLCRVPGAAGLGRASGHHTQAARTRGFGPSTAAGLRGEDAAGRAVGAARPV